MTTSITGVSVSDVTRFLSSDPRGTVSAEVTIDLGYGGPGPGSRITIEVDLQDTDHLSFTEIESRALGAALAVLTEASCLDVEELDRVFRAKFLDLTEQADA